MKTKSFRTAIYACAATLGCGHTHEGPGDSTSSAAAVGGGASETSVSAAVGSGGEASTSAASGHASAVSVGAGGQGATGGNAGAGGQGTGGEGGATEGCVPVANLVVNPSFEVGTYSPTAAPDDWSFTSFQASAIGTWSEADALTGTKSVTITAPTPNDASWQQNVPVDPGKLYFLSGWIKTDDVSHTSEFVDAGANVSLFGTFSHSPGLFGTHDWTRAGVLFNAGQANQITIAARLGFFSGTASGTARFDDLRVSPIVPLSPHPHWRILTLVYASTDFQTVDAQGVAHHYVGHMSPAEVAAVESSASLFVNTDIPALTSGNMIPELTIREPGTLTSLTPFDTGFWPAPEDTAIDQDPAFDSVIVIWDPRVVDEISGQASSLASAAGLTPARGTDQTYTTLIFDAAATYGHRNVFKHEWGHSITEFFDAAGVAPKPKVENHAVAGQYVHCGTGAAYVWVDETTAMPIPNSIYNDGSGFTHDYYSGMTAAATDPTHCLGITPDAWAMGGPVSHSGNLCESSPCADHP